MDRAELARWNVGETLDNLMNLDPRGYGVCRILYNAARETTGAPLSMHAAERLAEAVEPGDVVHILTGFVLLPHKKGEMDGIMGSMMLARSLVLGLGAKPVIICPAECLDAIRNLAWTAGLHLYDSVEEMRGYPLSMAAFAFPKEPEEAERRAEELIGDGLPAAVIAIECPGANTEGVYHNSMGMDVTELEAKSDILYQKLQDRGVPSFAVGDLGNEIGMAAIYDHIRRFIPRAGEGGCVCGCPGGIAAATGADHMITATVSDWGCYALCAALAYLKRDPEILHDRERQREGMLIASRSGMVDMSGSLAPAIDGFGLEMNESLVTLMGECIRYPLQLEESVGHWFDKTLELGYFQGAARK